MQDIWCHHKVHETVGKTCQHAHFRSIGKAYEKKGQHAAKRNRSAIRHAVKWKGRKDHSHGKHKATTCRHGYRQPHLFNL